MMSSSSSYDPSLPLQDSSVLPGDRLETVLSASNDSHLVPSLSSSSVCSQSLKGGVACTMREYEDQLSSFKRENLNLKLRIYMMENAIGFHGNDEKNALKLNVDLRVENEELKKELSDRKDLLGQAYSTLSNFEEVYKATEEKVEGLEKENTELKDANRKLISAAKRLTKGGRDTEVGMEILQDAFGTLSADDSGLLTLSHDKKSHLDEDLHKSMLEILFGGEGRIPKDPNDILKEVRLKIQTPQTREVPSLGDIQQWVLSTHSYLSGEAMPDSIAFELHEKDPARSVQSALKKLSELADAMTIKDQLLFRLEDELESNRKLLDEAETLKDSHVHNQRLLESKAKEIEGIHKELETRSEKLTKSYEFCQSLTNALKEQKSLVEKFKKDMKTRDEMIKKLTEEYNNIKAKFRARHDVSESQVKEEKALKSCGVTGGTSEVLTASLKKFRDDSLRKGCMSAMKVYQARMKSIQMDVNSAVKLMRGRLQELAEFLQRLLEINGDEEARRKSRDFLESLHTSLSETARLSTSLLNESSILNESIQFGDNIMEEIESAFVLQEDNLLESVLSDIQELSDEETAFCESMARQVASTSPSEMNELKSSLEEERLLVEKMSEVQLQLKKELNTVKEESELKSDEIKRVYGELESKTSHVEEVETQIQDLSSQITEIQAREGVLQADYKEELEGLQFRLSESLATKDELASEIQSLIEEKTRIQECCSENEGLKDELRRAREELESLKEMLSKDKAKRAEIEKQMTKQLLKTRKVLKQTRQMGPSDDSPDKEN